jgi:hypothetical protein
LRELILASVFGTGGLLVGLMIGIALMGVFGYWETGGINIPFNLEHIGIAGNIQVIVAGKTCESHHVLTTIASFVPQDVKADVKDIFAFANGGQFTQSLWTFTQSNNVRVSMKIWGPAENTTTYIIEFGRLTFQDVEISGFDFSISWTGGSDGYALRSVTYP